MNLINQIVRLFTALLRYTAGAAGYTYELFRAYVMAIVLKIIVTGVLFFTFWMIGWKTGIALVGLESALFLLSAWMFGDFVVKVLSGIGAFIFRIKDANKEYSDVIYKTLSKLLEPVVFCSLIITFLAIVASIKGVKTLTFESLILWILVILFFHLVSIFSTRRPFQIHPWLVTGVVILLLTHIIIPVQSNAVINFVDRLSKHGSTSLDRTDDNGDLIGVPKGTTLYNDELEKIKDTEANINGKVVNTVHDDISGEPLYEVIFPNKKGDYTKGKNYFVPVRLVTKPFSEVRNESYFPPPQTPPQTPTSVEETKLGSVPNNVTVKFYSKKPFALKIRTERGTDIVTLVNGDTHYFAWGGDVVVNGDRKDISCEVIKKGKI